MTLNPRLRIEATPCWRERAKYGMDRIWLQDTKGEVGCEGRWTCQNLEWNGHKVANNDSSKMPTITYFSFTGLHGNRLSRQVGYRDNSSRKCHTIKSQLYNHHNVPRASKNEKVHMWIEIGATMSAISRSMAQRNSKNCLQVNFLSLPNGDINLSTKDTFQGPKYLVSL